MKFQINLDPVSAAPYFTVQEHLRRFSASANAQANLKRIEESLRQFLSLTSAYNFSIIPVSKKENLLWRLDQVIYVDNPFSGRNELAAHRNLPWEKTTADISFSFPQCMQYDLSGFDAIMCDTSASLGVPAAFLVLFSQDPKNLQDQQIVTEFSEDIYVLSEVLNDLEEKKMEMLLRESNYKAAVLYQLIDSHQYLNAIVDKESRSKTVIATECEPGFANRIEGLGYRFHRQELAGKARISIANYATQSKELIEMFVDRVSEL
jgi:hypothetical protein